MGNNKHRNFYWVRFGGLAPEVVEIDGDSLYRVGKEIVCRKINDVWHEGDKPLTLDFISEPLTTPE